MNRIELSQLQCMHENSASDADFADCRHNRLPHTKIVAILWYDLHVRCVCDSFLLDNFQNEFQLSVPLNTVPSVKIMADNDAIPVHLKAKGRKKIMIELHSYIVPLEYFKAIPDRFNFTVSQSNGVQFEGERQHICNGYGI